MALYLGADKVKLRLGEDSYIIKINPTIPIYDGVLLITKNELLLKDKNGLIITAKREEE